MLLTSVRVRPCAERAVFERDLDDVGEDVLRELTLGTFDLYVALGEVDVDAARDRDRKLTNS
jgi:hypothetical protein